MMRSILAGHVSIRVMSCPARAKAAPIMPPMAPTPSTAILTGVDLFCYLPATGQHQ